MKRDPELIRAILLKVEEHHDHIMPNIGAETHYQTLSGHVNLLQDAGYLSPAQPTTRTTYGYRITWQGHEFLDTTRDTEIWAKTKNGAEKLGSWSIKLLGELAVGFVRAKAVEMGVPIMT